MPFKTKRLDKRTALRLLAQVVKEHGEDFVYKSVGFSCIYFDGAQDQYGDVFIPNTDRPSCLIAQVAAAWGNQEFIDFLAKHNATGLGGLWDKGLGEFLTPGAYQVLVVAQRQQDDFRPWGEALRAARSA